MRLCEHLHVPRQGGGLNSSPGKARWASFRVLEPHVTATKIHRARHTRRHKVVAFVRSTVQKRAYLCRGDGACSMSASWLISYLYLDNTMASHVD